MQKRLLDRTRIAFLFYFARIRSIWDRMIGSVLIVLNISVVCLPFCTLLSNFKLWSVSTSRGRQRSPPMTFPLWMGMSPPWTAIVFHTQQMLFLTFSVQGFFLASQIPRKQLFSLRLIICEDREMFKVNNSAIVLYLCELSKIQQTRNYSLVHIEVNVWTLYMQKGYGSSKQIRYALETWDWFKFPDDLFGRKDFRLITPKKRDFLVAY